MKKALLIPLLSLTCALTVFAQDGWINLFNGKDFTGWKQLNGEAKYHVENNEVVGVSTLNTPNSFMTTEKTYGDFIFEVEVRVDARLNSGIQFRSLSKPDYRDGRVHGYQAEIDPSPRAWSGGIYDEARRGWLYPLTDNPEGQKAFRNGAWNKYRIEAIGTQIRIWVNGINTANINDDETAEGFIALQVHSIRNKEQEGSQVRWRNIRIKTTDLEKERWPMFAKEINYIPNTLTDYEKRKGWRLLWDAKSTDGWRGAKSDAFPAKGWEMKDGVLTVLESGGGESEHGGDIITVDTYSDFELIVDFNITEGANSGIKYFVDPELNKGTGSAIGMEFQVLDDSKHPDAKKGVMGNRTVGSLYDLIKAENLSAPSRNKGFHGVGKWNRARIVVNGGHVQHWLNEMKVVEFDRHSQIFRALVAYSKYAKWENFGQIPEGHILLQDQIGRAHV